jgi:threonylcarbamoyladenosine tRNA methylthiotransferase MtaB
MTTFAVKFLGCKVSQADAMLARRAMLAAGHQEAPEAQAELQIINTCCITSEAEAKSRKAARRAARQAGQVLVSGCAVNLNAGQFAEVDPRVRPFVGTAEEVAEAMAGAPGACVDLEHDILARKQGRGTRTQGLEPGARTRGFIKVQDGCDCHCAYCIIPTVRGPARSRPAAAVLAEA